MFMMRQGDISSAKRVEELEKRVEMLENVVKALQSQERPKVGRPPKVSNELKSDPPG
jgi:chaperonin cofactor prefoldin